MKKYIDKRSKMPNICVLISDPMLGNVRHHVTVRYTDKTWATVPIKDIEPMPGQEDVEPSELDKENFSQFS